MNIGYVMIGTILLYVVTNLVTILVVGVIEICAFFRKCCCKKGKERYQVDTSFKDTTFAVAIAVGSNWFSSAFSFVRLVVGSS